METLEELQRFHEWFWGVPYGPTLTMLPNGWRPIGVMKDLRDLQLKEWEE